MYNVEKYLARCLDSLYIDQNTNIDDFETIIVDDESPDNSIAIAMKYAEKYNNITVIRQKNKGLGGARNTGIENAKGDYLLFIDSDDFCSKGSLSKLIEISSKSNLDVIEFGAQGVNKDGTIIYEVNFNNSQTYSGIQYCSIVDGMNSACNKVYSRNFLLKNKLFFREKLYIEDFEFNTRAFLLAKKVASCSLSVARFLQNDSSITRDKNLPQREKMYSDIITVTKLIRSLNDKHIDLASTIFIEKKITYLNVTLFYQLVKDLRNISNFRKIRKQLAESDCLFLDQKLSNRNKNIFRLLLVFLIKMKVF